MAARTFVALELSRPLRAGILRLAETLKARGVRASWSKDDTLHLTLKFLGDVEEADLPEVIEAVRRAARDVPPFSFTSGGVGAFPSARRPRVIWVGVEATEALLGLQAEVDRELAALGFPREERRWTPHVTVGRIRDPQGSSGFDATLASLKCPEETVDVNEVLVMKSTLAPGGAIHEAVARIRLTKPDPGKSPLSG